MIHRSARIGFVLLPFLVFAGARSCVAVARAEAPSPGKPLGLGQDADGGAKAAASSSVTAEIVLLHALNAADGGTGIDPRIGALPALRQPPFSSYNTYKLLGRTKLSLDKGSPATTTLPNGRVLQITLREALPKGRFRIAASINQPAGTTFLPLLEVTAPAREPFFVAGQSYQGGVLVVGITVLP